MKYLSTVFALCVLGSGVAFGQAAEKAAANSATSTVALATITANTPFTCTAWANILGTSIRPPGGKDLLLDFSAVSGLFTSNTNNTFGSSSTFTQENVGIQVRVLVDSNSTAVTPPAGTLATPGVLAWDNLIRSTSFTNNDAFSGTDFLGLVLNNGGARSYDFIKRDVGVGDHTVNVQSRFCYQNTASASFFSSASSSLAAVIGARTLTVEEVKLDAQ